MADKLDGRIGDAFLVKKGQAIPENAQLMRTVDVIKLQELRIHSFKPESEMRSFTKGSYIVAGNVGISGFLITNIIRENCHLGALKRGLTYGPSVVIPVMMISVVYDRMIKEKILLGEGNRTEFIATKAGLVTAFTGVGYPYFLAMLTSLWTARQNWTIQWPETGGSSYFKMAGKVSPTKGILALLCAGNFMAGFWVARRQSLLFQKYFLEPPNSSDSMEIDLNVNKAFE